jgi:hypothetical protein
LLCYHYDPLTGKYGLAISFVLRTAGTITVGGLGVFLFSMYRRERKRPRLVRAANGVSTKSGDNIHHEGQTAQAEA